MLLSFSAKESNQRKLPATLMFYERQWLGFACASRTTLMPDFGVNEGSPSFFPPTAEQLRMKSGKTMVACAAAGGKQVLLKRGNVGAKRMRETFAYLVLPDFAGQRPRAARSLSAVLIFWFFCIKTKELGPPAAMSGNDVFIYNTHRH